MEGEAEALDVIDLSMCSHLLSSIKCSWLRPHLWSWGRIFKSRLSPRTLRLVFSSFLLSSLYSPFREESLFLSLVCCWPSLLPPHAFPVNGRVGIMHLSHAQFILVDQVSQANIYSGPKPLGRVFYNTDSSSQWGGLFSASSLTFGIGTWGFGMGPWSSFERYNGHHLGSLGVPHFKWVHWVSFHLALKVGSHPELFAKLGFLTL